MEGRKVELFVPASLRHAASRGRGAGPAPVFEWDLVEALRPRLVVALGVGMGAAFAVLCQAVRDCRVDALLYGIDPFSDDGDKPEDDESRWESVNNFLHTHYRGSSYLLRSPPPDTLRHFADGSIDLLRVDSRRLGTPLAEFLGPWLPKIAPGGVLLSAGVDPGGVAPEFPAGAIPLGGPDSLFVARKSARGPEPEPSPLLRALSSTDAAEREGLAAFYEHVFLHHALRAEIEEKRFGLHRKKAGA
ncbi:MAG TPA: class I SAM-dependent methyltransferase [Polyangiaceae bacterium]|nr:class I SAM-dependent methyltransferase [Polyangiaceae bacterium]